MKTAIEILEEFICLNNYTEEELINKILELKIIEKEIIKTAYYQGNIDGYYNHQLMTEENNEKYFRTTFDKR